MRARGKPTRLEQHRLAYEASGRRGNLIQLSSLEPEEKKLIQSELIQDVRIEGIDFSQEGDELKFDRVYLDILNRWGIMCPHPHSSVEPCAGGKAFRCEVCECVVMLPPIFAKVVAS